jgi:ferritin-like metal-binding protein YciE
MEHNTYFITWLHNAHAMETNLIKVLEAHEEQAEGYPDVRTKIAEHLKATKNHAEVVKRILEDMDEDTSTMKSAMGNVTGMATGASTAMAKDKLIKNAIADYAAEHMEIATYNGLITAARELGHEEIIPDLEDILKDEKEMADWLEKNLPNAVTMFLEEEGKK